VPGIKLRALQILGKNSTTELLPQSLVFWDRFSLYSSEWPWIHYVVQTGLKLVILLSQLPKC
jgi:hypothetical protein